MTNQSFSLKKKKKEEVKFDIWGWGDLNINVFIGNTIKILIEL